MYAENFLKQRRNKHTMTLQATIQDAVTHAARSLGGLDPDCHGRLKEIGSCVQRQELVYVPAQLKRVDHIQHAYKCDR